MGQRVQIHIKKDNNFYAFHYQNGWGMELIKEAKNLILMSSSKDFKKEIEKLPNYDKDYYNPDRGDNNNGIFILDCHSNKWCFSPGFEELRGVVYYTPFKYRRPLSAGEYIELFDDYEKFKECVEEVKELEKAFFKEEDKMEKEEYLLFLKESESYYYGTKNQKKEKNV